MLNKRSHSGKECCRLQIPTFSKQRMVFALIVLAFIMSAAGVVPVQSSAESAPRNCEESNLPLRYYTPGDYDGDGKADIAVFRREEGVWYVLQSSNEQLRAVVWGAAGDKLVPADYDGDRMDDYAVFRSEVGTWWILRSSDNQWYSRQFGDRDSEPVPADYDGDGKADIAIARSGGQYEILKSTDGSLMIISSPNSPESNHNDVNVPGDYDGDDQPDPGVFSEVDSPTNGARQSHIVPREWDIKLSSGGRIVIQFGQSGDEPVPGDYDGDRKTDIAVWRPSDGVWYIRPSSMQNGNQISANSMQTISWGMSGDKVTPADYDGDGKTDMAVWRPADSVWYIISSSTGHPIYRSWGLSSDIPIPMVLKRHEH